MSKVRAFLARWRTLLFTGLSTGAGLFTAALDHLEKSGVDWKDVIAKHLPEGVDSGLVIAGLALAFGVLHYFTDSVPGSMADTTTPVDLAPVPTDPAP